MNDFVTKAATLWKSLAGSRTNIVCAIYAVVTVLGATGVTDPETTEILQNILLAVGGLTLRAAIADMGIWIGGFPDPPKPDTQRNEPPSTIPFKNALLVGLLLIPVMSAAASDQSQPQTRIVKKQVCDGRRCYWLDVVETLPSASPQRTEAGHVPHEQGRSRDKAADGLPPVRRGFPDPAETPDRTSPQPLQSRPETFTSMQLSPETRSWFRNPDGSCVQCSIGMAGVHCNDINAASLLWDTEHGPAERGGSWPTRVEAYCDRRGIKAWSVTGSSVDETIPWLAWAARTGRFAAMGAGTAHFQTLYGFDPSSKEWIVCNNNSTHKLDRYDEQSFRRLHAASGPWCVVLQTPSSDPPKPVAWWK